MRYGRLSGAGQHRQFGGRHVGRVAAYHADRRRTAQLYADHWQPGGLHPRDCRSDLQTWREVGFTYLNVGIDHIPLGVYHLLFVLGMIFLVGGGWRLVKTITAFTLGHSASLAAAAYRLLGVPEAPLNACIAFSIVFVGVELVKQRRGTPGLTARYPWAIAFSFGLVHGIGFAGALAALGIERSLLFPALLSFNVGVEIGQLASSRWCCCCAGAIAGSGPSSVAGARCCRVT